MAIRDLSTAVSTRRCSCVPAVSFIGWTVYHTFEEQGVRYGVLDECFSSTEGDVGPVVDLAIGAFLERGVDAIVAWASSFHGAAPGTEEPWVCPASFTTLVDRAIDRRSSPDVGPFLGGIVVLHDRRHRVLAVPGGAGAEGRLTRPPFGGRTHPAASGGCSASTRSGSRAVPGGPRDLGLDQSAMKRKTTKLAEYDQQAKDVGASLVAAAEKIGGPAVFLFCGVRAGHGTSTIASAVSRAVAESGTRTVLATAESHGDAHAVGSVAFPAGGGGVGRDDRIRGLAVGPAGHPQRSSWSFPRPPATRGPG